MYLQEAKLRAIVNTTAQENAAREAQSVQDEQRDRRQRSLKNKLSELYLESLEERLKQELGVSTLLFLSFHFFCSSHSSIFAPSY